MVDMQYVRIAIVGGMVWGGCLGVSPELETEMTQPPGMEPDAGSPAPCAPEWRVEPIAGGIDVAVHSAHVVEGRAGAAHVVYSDIEREGDVLVGGALEHAHGSHDHGWTVETVDAPRVIGQRAALARDGWGDLHVLYAKQWTVEYAHRGVDGAWMTTEIDSFDQDDAPGERWLHAVADSAGGVHGVYSVGTSRDRGPAMRYGYKPRGGAWLSHDIAPLAGAVSASVAADATGAVHLAYRDADGVGYAYRQPDGAWRSEPVSGPPEATATAQHPSLAVDGAGGVHIVLDTGAYGYRAPGSGWDASTFAPDAEHADLAVDAEGGVHIAYAVKEPCDGCAAPGVYYAHRAQDGTWMSEPVWLGEGERAELGAPSIFVGSAGDPASVHLTYTDHRSGAIGYATRCLE